MTGLSINLGDNYTQELPDFKIAVNYLIDNQQSNEKILENMAKFSVNSLKVWHETFGVDYNQEYLSIILLKIS
ncbi:hypothetical protein [Spiroplasma endosymbiont of Cantharis rufa]|uniref:hypothetical protein n=1 Tax=Spiroplasma endosymbiont of Cantharis rufa TaxID=3066279 RepID=UPI0030CD589E